MGFPRGKLNEYHVQGSGHGKGGEMLPAHEFEQQGKSHHGGQFLHKPTGNVYQKSKYGGSLHHLGHISELERDNSGAKGGGFRGWRTPHHGKGKKSGQDFNILGHAALPGGHAGYGR
jgi:hypothetical protein